MAPTWHESHESAAREIRSWQVKRLRDVLEMARGQPGLSLEEAERVKRRSEIIAGHRVGHYGERPLADVLKENGF